MEFTLWNLCTDDYGTIQKLPEGSPISRRLMELGFVPGERVKKLLHNSGMGAYLVRGTLIALRKNDAVKVSVCREVPHGESRL